MSESGCRSAGPEALKNAETLLLMRLVSARSESGNEAPACRLLASTLPEFGWERVKIDDAGSVVATRGSGDKELILLGHIDTVPGGPEVRLDGDVLWGRGSVDAKGPLCTFAVAGGCVDVPRGWRVTLVAAVGEETNSIGTRARLPLHKPAACVIGEPSGTDGVTIAYRGSLLLKLHAEDGGAHLSGDGGPLTATLRAAAEILDEVEALDNPQKPVIERYSGAIAGMSGRDEGRREASILLNLRVPLGVRPEGMAELAAQTARLHNVTLEVVDTTPPHAESRDNAVVRALRTAIRMKGCKPRLLAKGGTADFNLAAQWGCPMAAYGPGDSHLDHTSEEHISLRDYMKSIEILQEALRLMMTYDDDLEHGGHAVPGPVRLQ